MFELWRKLGKLGKLLTDLFDKTTKDIGNSLASMLLVVEIDMGNSHIVAACPR
jgi:hypothetical protein